LRTFGFFGEFEQRERSGITALGRVRSLSLATAGIVRAGAVRFAPALVTTALVSALALSRIGASGAVKPVAGIQIGRGSEIVLDEVSSTDVAAAVAVMGDLIVTDQIVAQAEALSEQSQLSGTVEDQLIKPQVVATDVVTRQDIVKHTVAEGETLDSIAKRYNVTTDTIKWANGLSRNRVSTGTKLTILPINGILHTVVNGDSPDSLANLYRANARQIIAFNDAEVTGLVEGQRIVIPDGIKPAPRRSLFSLSRSRYIFSTSWTYLGRYTQFPNPGGYGRGWCTHWAAYRAGVLGNPIGGQWGNASSWPNSARNTGAYYVDHTPRRGAVAQRGNHVVVIEAVSEDGSMVRYSDMNGVGGWGNAVLYNDWVPASSFAWYISHK
jgi:LysM repeat protein